ncbi:helix-turn-helix domain-containing protein [Photobacterium alginatilyticum]|uniref:AraC family transcriptional regulator n=1 Tax=Photobacterium alginatilyticum TaxID=1775171 RepID=A0ABW9YPY2_9GAMM|nr:helix-turn-helix domain-containing protein [Photobacterium alginatilyticum]NBI55891.1 AraC family transcriptional regulator [Photobacterium alginatilyticum]
MVKIRHLTYDSIEQYSLSCDPLNQVVCQLSRGEFEASRYVLSFPKLEASKEITSNKVLYHGVCTSDYLYIAFFNRDDAITVNGVKLGYDDVFIVAPNEEIVSVLPPGVEVFVLLIKKRYLVDVLGEEEVSNIIKLSSEIRNRKVILPKTQLISKRVISIIEYSIRYNVFISPEMSLLVQDYILRNVKLLFNKPGIYTESSFVYDKRFVIILRAFAYINLNIKSKLEVGDLARNCFCSTRTLEYAFKKVISISPKQFLLMARLNFARFEFERKFGSLSVGETLKKMNVENPGRFSGEYFELFHEYPKDTLKRNKAE